MTSALVRIGKRVHGPHSSQTRSSPTKTTNFWKIWEIQITARIRSITENSTGNYWSSTGDLWGVYVSTLFYGLSTGENLVFRHLGRNSVETAKCKPVWHQIWEFSGHALDFHLEIFWKQVWPPPLWNYQGLISPDVTENITGTCIIPHVIKGFRHIASKWVIPVWHSWKGLVATFLEFG